MTVQSFHSTLSGLTHYHLIPRISSGVTQIQALRTIAHFYPVDPIIKQQ
jgi:hypothetical protein